MESNKKSKSEQQIEDQPYFRSLLTMKILLPINNIGRHIKQNLEKKISSLIEGRCTVEGYIKPDSVRIQNYSSGKVNGEYVEYICSYESWICYPVENMKVECTCKTITKAGIHSEVIDKKGNIPIVIFIARDHHLMNSVYENVRENTKMIVSIIGVRFELNDDHVSAIGKLIDIVSEKPILQIHED
jgi:hypothetical protein